MTAARLALADLAYGSVTHACGLGRCTVSQLLCHALCLCLPCAEREGVSVSNLASTMITLMVGNPLIPVLDFSALRLLSCGGSPQSPITIVKAIAAFGCEFFVSVSLGQGAGSCCPCSCVGAGWGTHRCSSDTSLGALLKVLPFACCLTPTPFHVGELRHDRVLWQDQHEHSGL